MSSTQRYSGWGRAIWAKGTVRRPTRPDLVRADAPARGQLRSYGDAALRSDGAITDMTQLDRVLRWDPSTGLIEVEAGMRLGELLRVTLRHGWRPAVLPGTGFATVGGAIAMDVHGKNHHCEGSFGQHVRAITLQQATGQRRITPADDTLWRATCGGLGQTGIILSAELRLIPAQGDVMVVTEQRAPDWDSHLALLDQSDAPYVVGWIDATAKGAALGRGIVEEARPCPGIPRAAARPKSVPFTAPHWTLAPPVVKTFNSAYYHRVPKSGRSQVRRFEDFFFPLDKLHDWNRLYGKRGFHQFQCVLPLNAAPTLRAMLDQIAQSGLASPLAVLKRMGPGRAGFMSFPMEGYTLAVDFPNRPAAHRLIGQLEQTTADNGGRIYLAKDALARGDMVRPMYPDHDKWARSATQADPKGALITDMVARLGLRPQEDRQ